MKSRFWNRISAAVLFAVVGTLVGLVAQEQTAQAGPVQHHHYALIDMGTFGGPSSYFNSLRVTDALQFGSVFYNIAQIENGQGLFVGFADTSTPDPYPGFCYTPDCFVNHAFQWTKGVKTDLGTLPGGASSAAFAINERGWITGNSQNGQTDPLIPGLPELRAVFWKNGKIHDLGTLGGSTSFAQAINNRGQITGLALNGIPDPFSYYYFFLYNFPGGTQTRAFLWDEKAGMQDLGTLGGPDAFPSLINQHGQVAGYSYINSTPDPNVGRPPYHPFLWEKGKGMKDLGSFGGVQTASVNGLNERGQVAGGLLLPGDQINHPFLWDGKKLLDLVAPPFGPGNGEANWVNDAGEVVGGASLPAVCPAGSGEKYVRHGFLWRKGAITDLGSISSDISISEANYINSKSQVVGNAFNCADTVFDAFLWERGSMVDLNTLLSPASAFHLYFGVFIDNSGTIAAFALTPDQEDSHAVLLVPCDQAHPNIKGCDYSMAETESP